MDTELKGKNVLITGGASGIGLGISKVLAKEGMNIAIASRNPDPAVKAQLESYGIKCILLFADLSKEDGVEKMVNEAISGLGHLDAYVNNAAGTWHESITKITLKGWQNTIDTNLKSCIFACKEITKHMIARGKGGNIIIIGSTVRFFPAFKETSYRISKVGLKIFMEQLTVEMAPHGIRVNMVTPGHFITKLTSSISPEAVKKIQDITPGGRTGDPIEIGNAVAFLLSEALSGFTYGADLVIDGGLTLHPLLPPDAQKIRELNL
ncbi:MAG: SDR family oxidoreductase [Actinobacteria bacterium]|nr:SDR family oxidoreductase [Actinomycetota bacterium]